MKKPTQCVLWSNPEIIDDLMKERFELLDTYIDESHLWRYLLKCRECGQLYFFEFYEEIDWVGGDDAQYVKYIPVETPEDIEALKKADILEIFLFLPQLRNDFPTGAEKATLGWVEK